MHTKYYCFLSVIPMRSEPSEKAEMISQLLFGEIVTLIEQKGEWLFVANEFDCYEGWVSLNQVLPFNPPLIEKLESSEFIIAIEAFSIVGLQNTSCLVSMGSQIVRIDNVCIPKINTTFINTKFNFSHETLISTTHKWLNVPYLWGGKSIFGTDCSGFVQTVYKCFNIKLPRDAYQQATIGESVLSLNNVQVGDLAFFENEKGKVTHVGILIAKNQIIHASGFVKIDKFDERGIWNVDKKLYTHNLHSIRRVVMQ